jgi:peptide/nickel transport system permease protein
MRERAYVQVAKLNGVNDMEIIFKEMIPNLLPFIAASLVGASAGAVLASLGLSALGLGPQNEPSIGLTIFWVLHYGALIRELWWWFMPPIIVMVLLFMGLFMITAGLDRIANPRLRTTV